MSNLERSLASSSVAQTLGVYEQWAENYNHDVIEEKYIAPRLAGDCLMRNLASRNMEGLKILDAGCGTGLVGEHLARHGAKHMDGIDLSPKMIEVARRSDVYQSLKVADLSRPLDVPSQSYDAVICVGTMTEGHVGPSAFDELVRIAKPGGLVISTVRESVWQKNGYQSKVGALVDEGWVKVAEDGLEMHEIATGVRAVFVVLKV
ncbi:S-adenosyl-L-methionine-dependent methyltransferase [Thelonectria olida]|uniref:S-adenosyl-L-methionine-dependent methyltransferase n=1 Tax=Thelonectria olida TaxID=1576542 RepID=A0A9P8W080_9HYPO|nr:S-adenosyl-L-methionine-dependent methyltransferase [Thelonectria olida]